MKLNEAQELFAQEEELKGEEIVKKELEKEISGKGKGGAKGPLAVTIDGTAYKNLRQAYREHSGETVATCRIAQKYFNSKNLKVERNY